MNARRWIAISVVIGLLFISLGFRAVTSIASSVNSGIFDELVSNDLTETVLLDGSLNSKIVVIDVHGVIQAGDSGGLFSATDYNHNELLNIISHTASDKNVEGIILDIDTPGGGVSETAQVYRALVDLQEHANIPIYVSMGNTAASGGYYIAALADKIFAEPATLTGSIGVIMETVDYSQLAEKYGIVFNTIKSGKHKDIMTASREMTTEEEEILQSIIDEMYNDFVDVIVAGRDLSEQEVREIGDGRVYTGRQAQEIGLVDEIGSFDDALYSLMDDYDLGNASVVTYETYDVFSSLFNVEMPEIFKSKNSELDTIMGLLEQSDKPRALYLY